MAITVKTSSLKINTMPEEVYNNYLDNNLINDNELYLVEDGEDAIVYDLPIASLNADYAICFEWVDGNPNLENRNHRFVQLVDDRIKFATSVSDVCGVTTTCAAFIENYGVHSAFTSNVGVLGIVTVIDNGRCSVGGTCMPDEDGFAKPSDSEFGFKVIKRVDASKISVFVKPETSALHKLETMVGNVISENIQWITDADVDSMLAGIYK